MQAQTLVVEEQARKCAEQTAKVESDQKETEAKVGEAQAALAEVICSPVPPTRSHSAYSFLFVLRPAAQESRWRQSRLDVVDESRGTSFDPTAQSDLRLMLNNFFLLMIR